MALPVIRPVVFPMLPIVDGKCACGVESCSTGPKPRAGKHPAIGWADLEYGVPVPRPVAGDNGAGYGVKTGAEPKGSGVFVIDLDGEEASLLFDEMGDCPDTYTVQTPRAGGGWHLYFKHPGFHVQTCAGLLAPGIDVRGDGGMVVGPGSPHINGGRYESVDDTVPIADAPEWLLERLRALTGGKAREAQQYPGDVEPGPQRDYHRRVYAEWLATEAPPRGPALRGKGDQTLFDVVQRGAYDLALPVEDVLELVREHYDPRCSPMWADELEERVHHKAHDAKTKSARTRFEPVPEDVLSLGDAPGASPAVAAPSTWLTPAERALKVGGSVARLATNFPTIDKVTRGGLLLGKVVAVGGAPGAGKTAWMIKLASQWLGEGIACGFLAADEDPDAVLIRFGQLIGLSRDKLESGDEEERARLADWCRTVPLILVDGDEDGVTIDSVSKALRESAGEGRSVLFVDSMQTARSGGPPERDGDPRARVNAVVRALKVAGKRDGHLVIASSELARGAYRNRDQAENVTPLSAFKESGDVEYGVALALVLVSVPGSSDLVDAEIVKNRLGHGKPPFLLRHEHARADVFEGDPTMRVDPLEGVKSEILSVLSACSPMPLNRNQIVNRVGGRKETVLRAVREMLEAKQVHEETGRGVRALLPGDPGYKG